MPTGVRRRNRHSSHLVSEYQQYQCATADEEGEFDVYPADVRCHEYNVRSRSSPCTLPLCLVTFHGRISTKEVDEQMLSVQNKNSLFTGCI